MRTRTFDPHGFNPGVRSSSAAVRVGCLLHEIARQVKDYNLSAFAGKVSHNPPMGEGEFSLEKSSVLVEGQRSVWLTRDVQMMGLLKYMQGDRL
jgi:hypothetical protein